MENIKKIVKKSYTKIAKQKQPSCGCNCGSSCKANEKIAEEIGYSKQDIKKFSSANLGLGCGNPIALGEIKKGDVVLDLGSGAGFDAFLAVKKVGKTGKVIGVDMTEEMIKKATLNAKKYGYKNVEFKLGDIEDLPIEDETIDVIISNCVINLAPNKNKVFEEAYRVLKKGGKLFVSDIVLLKELSKEQRENEELLAGCVGNAILKNDYISMVEKTGFEITTMSEDVDISKRQYEKIPLESLKLGAIKK
jgi:arsenite methyltransferase